MDRTIQLMVTAMTIPTAEHTKTQYSALQDAYDHLNGALFEGLLPPCLITLNRRPKSYGYFIGDNFNSMVQENEKTSEIALNPDTFKNRTDKKVLSTLAHEMVHLWQHIFGKPSRGRYHNVQWAKKMKEIGLYPSDTGEAGGKETGDKVSHYIINDGRFDVAATHFLEQRGNTILWYSGDILEKPGTRKAKSTASKTKFVCPDCEQSAWAKPAAKLKCGACDVVMVAEKIEDEDNNEEDYDGYMTALEQDFHTNGNFGAD